MKFCRFPVEYQMDSHDCGPASLKIIAKHFGKYYSLQYLRDRCDITKEGVSLHDISVGAEYIGLRTLAVKCDVNEIVNSVPFPLSYFGTTIILSWCTMPTRNTFTFPTPQEGA